LGAIGEVDIATVAGADSGGKNSNMRTVEGRWMEGGGGGGGGPVTFVFL